jgi:hypothetical protein
MKAQDYFAMPGVSSHMLIEMMRSPLHCWAKYLDPKRPQEPPTTAQGLGTLVHTLALTPELFREEYSLPKTINRRTRAGKAAYAALLNLGKQLLTQKDFQTASAMVQAIHQHPLAHSLLKEGEPEKIMAVTRESALLPLKGRLDCLSHQRCIVELKTAADARKDAFLYSVYRYGYHLSAAYYQMLVSRLTGTPALQIPHTFIVVETKPPYAVGVYETSETLLGQGRELWESQLARFDACWLQQDWPGYRADTLLSDKSRSWFVIEEGELAL